MPLSSKISRLCSARPLRQDVELFNVAVALTGVFIDASGPGEGERQGLCVTSGHIGRGEGGLDTVVNVYMSTVNGTNRESLTWCK